MCRYVNRNYLDITTIEVTGMPTAPWANAQYTDMNTWETKDLPDNIKALNPNGTYHLVNADSTSQRSYVWKKSDGCVITFDEMMIMGWVIAPGEDYTSTTVYLKMESSPENTPDLPVMEDYTSYNWEYYNGSSTSNVGSVVLPKPSSKEKTWTGYKLSFNSESGKWTIDYNELIENTYTDYMPIIGHIYDQKCTSEFSDFDFEDKYKYVCPINLTSNGDAVNGWGVSLYNGTEGHPAFYAFDGDLTTYAECNYTGLKYIQWRSINHPVSVKQLKIISEIEWTVDSSNNRIKFEVSNDGVNWFQIPLTPATQEYEYNSETGASFITSTITFKENTDFYSYFRLSRINYDSYSFKIYDIKAFLTEERNVPVSLPIYSERTPLFFTFDDNKDYVNGNHLPFGQEAYFNTNTGQTLSSMVVDDRTCHYLSGGMYIYGANMSDYASFLNEDLTIGLWVKANTATPERMTMFGYGNYYSGQNINFELRNGSLGMSLSYDDADDVGAVTRTFDASTWHHVVLVHHDIFNEFYLDGVLIGTLEKELNLPIKYNLYYRIGSSMGSNSNTNNYNFTGYFAKLQAYKYAFGSRQVAEWYANDGNQISL